MNYQTTVGSVRKHWSLTQDELARMVGLTQSALSRCENGETVPDLYVALALQVVFGRCPRKLFPDLYREIEETVMAFAARMDEDLRGRRDAISRKKQQLLLNMSSRATNSASGV